MLSCENKIKKVRTRHATRSGGLQNKYPLVSLRIGLLSLSPQLLDLFSARPDSRWQSDTFFHTQQTNLDLKNVEPKFVHFYFLFFFLLFFRYRRSFSVGERLFTRKGWYFCWIERCTTYLNGNSSDLRVRGGSIKSIWREKKSEIYAAFNNKKSNPEILCICSNRHTKVFGNA
jgi:hypothetical protein